MQSSLLLTILITTVVSIEFDTQIYGDIYQESRNLELSHIDNLYNEHKCELEMPALYFQTEKNVPIYGNGSNSYYHRLEVCCQGYIRSSYDWNRCIPDCKKISPNNCLNGYCRAPNQCICFDEFVENDYGQCIHTCPISCQYGTCHLNGYCKCLSGYELDHKTQKFCRPKCRQSCGNQQHCVSPDKCECLPGYQMSIELGCQPICVPDCGHGKCIAPNKCQCFSGYMKRFGRETCESECYIPCLNGFCESRFKCQCHDGFKYDNNMTTCLPDCGNNCEFGVCLAPGICRCFEGYEFSTYKCIPKCKKYCGSFGSCVEPNICGCGLGKILCKNGACNEYGSCICPKGLIHFINECIESNQIMQLLTPKELFNNQFKLNFDAILGQWFKFYDSF